MLFAILQKYDFSSKSQHLTKIKPTLPVVCDTAKVRFFKQITTSNYLRNSSVLLFAILQKYDFSSKSQRWCFHNLWANCCLRYCKSTIFQANHNTILWEWEDKQVVCDTAKVRFFKQITTALFRRFSESELFAILQKYDFSSKSQQISMSPLCWQVVCDTAKVRFFKQITTTNEEPNEVRRLFAILQKYDFSSKSQRHTLVLYWKNCCLRYCKSTIFQANHN